MSEVPATRRGALARLLADAARLDRSQSDPVVSFRNAIGVVAPLAIGAATGAASAGLSSTIGALQTAFADRPGPYRLRLLRMLATASATAVTSALATFLSPNIAASTALLVVLALIAGLLLAGGPAAAQTGTAATAAAVILGHIPQGLNGALHVALFVFIGGVGQAVLAIAAWPLGRHRPERDALGGLFSELAAAARAPSGTGSGPPAAAAVDTVRTMLWGLGHDYGPSVEAYRVLADEADRIRREVVTLAALVERLAESDPIGAGLLRGALTGAADVLDEVGCALKDGRPVDEATLEPARAAIRQADARLEEASPASELTRRAALARLDALGGQLRAAVETASQGASEDRRVEEPDMPGTRSLRDPLAILRANLSRDSAVVRHAVRLSLLVAASDVAIRLAGVSRGYWVPLTVLVVLRPDFSSTFQRAFLRVIGTVVGLLLATGLVHLVPGGVWWTIALVGLFTFATRLSGPNNIALTALALSGLVVVLLELSGVPARQTIVERSLATLVGGALALLAALFWPAWERSLLPRRLCELLSAYAELARVLSDPTADRVRRQGARAASRRARTNVQASIARARTEPVPATAAITLAEGVVASSHRVVHALMTVDAVRARVRAAGGCPELDELLRAAAAVLDECAEAVRTGGPVDRSVATLRPWQQRLADVLAGQPDGVGGHDVAGALAEASDRLANAVDTLVDDLRRRVDAQRPIPSAA